eukprot:TRINITY_DN16566_c0_g1_i1.p1 TRINITY_DN16566_c0_g1~~TRINITY_DN16566_c0_g1_i1.p1  ORF type:complete len:790 (+),score=330.31 TRINITY_DN16566_c0_g1_i1:86-2455(+)
MRLAACVFAVLHVCAASKSAVLQNGFVKVEVQETGGLTVYGDFSGKGAYGKAGIAGSVTEAITSKGVSTPFSVCSDITVVVNSTEMQQVLVNTSSDCRASSAATEQITITVSKGSRIVEVNTTGEGSGYVQRAFPFAGASIYNIFGQGVVQMMQQEAKYKMYRYPTYDSVKKVYALGGIFNGTGVAGQVSGALLASDVTSLGTDADKFVRIARANLGDVSFSQVLTQCDLSVSENRWSSNEWHTPCTASTSSQGWRARFLLTANNHDFPVLQDGAGITAAGAQADDAVLDYIALMTGVYASPVGNLCTHPNEVVSGMTLGQIATSLASPVRGYEGGYNFFDPDNYLALTAIMYAADADLLAEVKKVFMRSADFMDSSTGQLPHHFINSSPTFQAISGATQTGPNVFWIMTVLNYVKLTQDFDFLKTYIPTIQKATDFLVNQIVTDVAVPGRGTIQALLKAQGSLMIDVFIRTHFTTDTNVALVLLFRDLSEAYLSLGDTTNSNKFSNLASLIAGSVEAALWDTDHYITDLSPEGKTRDFIDYDANLLAISAGVADLDTRSVAILGRVDSGRCAKSHSFVSEKWYGPADTYGGNVGDSWTAMGRIAWYDAMSRKRVGQMLFRTNKTVADAALSHFNDVLVDPIRDAVLEGTWVRERFFCDATQQPNRTQYYFEYPSVAAMLIHRQRYGIEVGLTTHRIEPFGRTDFTYTVGFVSVQYSQSHVELRFPGTGSRDFYIGGMVAGKQYDVTVENCSSGSPQQVKGDAAGSLSFKAPVGDDGGAQCTVVVNAAS